MTLKYVNAEAQAVPQVTVGVQMSPPPVSAATSPMTVPDDEPRSAGQPVSVSDASTEVDQVMQLWASLFETLLDDAAREVHGSLARRGEASVSVLQALQTSLSPQKRSSNGIKRSDSQAMRRSDSVDSLLTQPTGIPRGRGIEAAGLNAKSTIASRQEFLAAIADAQAELANARSVLSKPPAGDVDTVAKSLPEPTKNTPTRRETLLADMSALAWSCRVNATMSRQYQDFRAGGGGMGPGNLLNIVTGRMVEGFVEEVARSLETIWGETVIDVVDGEIS
ncbi:hypothetical protein J8273_1329 [Carpediemonas membranifera]|uniref:Uncharacterized protein n=1 Tax=Carpediemonas membranifera TaxID=201153 RepID=A0A8J6B103_9EUKA|nr:hypothetical protein J8273_1329 [Carpediemonas membranifera]|eukprot:KAG9396980.1 hypothetical protein J8273_1329 [Carpediemonas membranifera]